MDWNGIIERNVERLLAVIAQLFFRSGLDEGGAAFLPRRAWRALLIMLRPAESDARRLIVMAARDLAVTLRAGVPRAFPAGLALNRDVGRVPAFCLIDPLKRFAPEGFEWGKTKVQEMPRISVPGLFDPVFELPKPIPDDSDLISPAAIRRRLLALRLALDHLPRQAKRLARWRARRNLARQAQKWKPGRMSPFRPGFAPGFHRSKPRVIDAILADCHYFAQEAWYADTS